MRSTKRWAFMPLVRQAHHKRGVRRTNPILEHPHKAMDYLVLGSTTSTSTGQAGSPQVRRILTPNTWLPLVRPLRQAATERKSSRSAGQAGSPQVGGS